MTNAVGPEPQPTGHCLRVRVGGSGETVDILLFQDDDHELQDPVWRTACRPDASWPTFVTDIAAAREFYSGYLGLSTEEFNLGWVARYSSPGHRSNIQLVTADATAPEHPVISVHTDDIEEAYGEARRLGFEIVCPITTESWGVRRFPVRAPDGNVVNIVAHRG